MKRFLRSAVLVFVALTLSATAVNADCLACVRVSIPDPDGGGRIDDSVCMLLTIGGGYECSDEGWVCVVFWPCDIWGIPPMLTAPTDTETANAEAPKSEQEAKSCQARAVEESMTMPIVKHSAS